MPSTFFEMALDNVVIDKSLFIMGAGSTKTTVDGSKQLNSVGSVFTIKPDMKVTLSHMTIKNGVGTNINALQTGGGINNGGTLTLHYVTITDNSALIGGGIYNDGRLNLNNVLISDNSAMFGAGVYNDGTVSTAIVNMNQGSSISGNKAQDSGGGIYNIVGTVNMNYGSSITYNTAIWGGGILNDGAGYLGAGYTTTT